MLLVVFRYTCTSIHGHFSWVKTLVEQCCQTCDGEVFPGGSVISVREDGSECGASITTECVSYGNDNSNLASVILPLFKAMAVHQSLNKNTLIRNVAMIQKVISNLNLNITTLIRIALT